jgi:uncharacterized protein
MRYNGMKLEHYPLEKLKEAVLRIFGKHLDLSQYKIFFFGSRVSGVSSERSDIDIGIEGLDKVPSDKWIAIQEEMENIPTLYKIEVIDFSRVSDKFKDVAKQHIEAINV